MKNLPLIALTTLSVALSGCARLIPPISVGDPIGLEGQQLTSSPLGAAAINGTLTYSTNGTPFNDLSTSKFPVNVTPTALEFRTGFSTVDLGGSCVAQANPPTTTVTLQSLSVMVDDATNPEASFTATPNVTMTLTWNAAQQKYVASNQVVSIKSGAATTAAFLKVLTTGGANQASVTANISVSQDSLAGCTLAFTMKDPEVILSDFR